MFRPCLKSLRLPHREAFSVEVQHAIGRADLERGQSSPKRKELGSTFRIIYICHGGGIIDS
jgi:hypothetical protein